MIQKEFAEKAISVLRKDPGVVGLAAAGSWISNELDEYSDLDLVLVTKNKIAAYTNHFNGSRNRICSTERRSVYSGEIFRTLTRGNRANNKEITMPEIIPCVMAFHEMVVVT